MERNITQEILKNQPPALEKNPLKKIGDTPMRYHLIPSAPKSQSLTQKMMEGYLHSEIAFIRFPAKLLAPMRNSLLVIHSAPKISSTMQ